MRSSWKLHLIIFWVAFVSVGMIALVVGWGATSGLTDEETSYLLYEPAFLILMVVLGLLLVIGSYRIGKIDKRILEIEDEVVKWAVKRGWKNPVMSEALRVWIVEEVESEEDTSHLLQEYALFSESRNNAWKILLGPVLQLLFLLTITSAAVPSAYWFLQENPNLNVMTAIVVLGGGIITSFYAISSLFMICPKVKDE